MAIRFSLLLGAVLLGGCLTPQNTRFPTLAYGDPKAERESYTLHDPLPASEGPQTNSRPLGFNLPRSEPRRAIEQSVPRTNRAGGMAPLPDAPGASQYPQTVTP